MVQYNHFKNIEEESDFILQLPLKELKKYAVSADFQMTTMAVKEPSAEYFTKEAALVQQLSLKELKNALGQNITAIPLEDKISKTGLTKDIIQQIEKEKEKASLENIIAYCKGLGIRFKDFLPEVFGVG
ncbi:MAG TPA: hypothetical protein ENJ95_15880 [Bacteroidetes bacterium]|nr:hypothetical protein [Bacteroidota bacterium]